MIAESATPALAHSTRDSSIDGSVCLGLVLDAEPDTDTELSPQERDSRIRWQGVLNIEGSMSVLG